MSTVVTRQEFASAVATAITRVDQLYQEVHSFTVALRDALAEEPSGLSPLRGTWRKERRNLARLVLRYEFGILFGPSGEASARDEADDEDEGTEIEADQPLLAVRIVMYTPRARGGFEPRLDYGVVSGWVVGDEAAPSDPSRRIPIAGHMLRRVPRVLRKNLAAATGSRVRTRAAMTDRTGEQSDDRRRISCRLPMGVQSVPLYSLASAEELDRLVSQMKDMWEAASDD